MKIAYLDRVRVERRSNTRPVQTYTASEWRIVNAQLQPLVDTPFRRLGAARAAAEERGLFLLEKGMRPEHLEVLWDFLDHYGRHGWRSHMNRIWHGAVAPWHLRDRLHLLLELRGIGGYLWLTQFKLPERFEIDD